VPATGNQSLSGGFFSRLLAHFQNIEGNGVIGKMPDKRADEVGPMGRRVAQFE
jgi:hypothetical protein